MNKPIAWLIEELDSTGKVVWSGLMMSKPTTMEWERDLKKKLHNIVITPLLADEKNIIKIDGIKKYDSKRLVEASSGL